MGPNASELKPGTTFSATAQVWPGDDLTTTATVEAVDERDGHPVVTLAVSTRNQDGVEVFAGSATARVDGDG